MNSARGTKANAPTICESLLLALRRVHGIQSELPAPIGQVVADVLEMKKEPSLQFVRKFRPRLGRIRDFARILRQIEKLPTSGFQRIDQLPSVGSEDRLFERVFSAVGSEKMSRTFDFPLAAAARLVPRSCFANDASSGISSRSRIVGMTSMLLAAWLTSTPVAPPGGNFRISGTCVSSE